MSISHPRILLAEDSTPDAKLLMKLLTESGFHGEFVWCTDGEMVLDSLLGKKESELPNLILMDIGLPRLNGHEILSRLREDGSCDKIPVIMLSSSTMPAEINKTYEAGVKGYYSKPLDLDGFERLVTKLVKEDFPRLGVG